MNRRFFAICAAVLTLAIHPTTAFAQDAQPSCIYDPAAEQFRAYDADADTALVGETLVGRDPPDVVVIDGLRFRRADSLRGTADELNRLIQPWEIVDGVQYFGVADRGSDLVAAISVPEACLLEGYRYAPVLHGVWAEQEQPFVFRFSGLAVDAASFRRDGDRAHGVGFLMLGHPHPDQDPALYFRQTIESDCKADRTRVIDTRSYAAENTLHQRFAEEGDWVANADLRHPATRALAHIVCNVPTEWPASTKLESLDAFSEQVHAAAHAGQ